MIVYVGKSVAPGGATAPAGRKGFPWGKLAKIFDFWLMREKQEPILSADVRILGARLTLIRPSVRTGAPSPRGRLLYFKLQFIAPMERQIGIG